jgi:hypothetical protein
VWELDLGCYENEHIGIEVLQCRYAHFSNAAEYVEKEV